MPTAAFSASSVTASASVNDVSYGESGADWAGPCDETSRPLVVQVIPPAADEFTCFSCFLVRHRSQIARKKDGHAHCVECEG
ncbi:DUF4193 domain-containing protein [Paenarthrobacter aurescens]|nr:DUF4193 family protein [Paenarthrobacter aurescens]MDO6143143.1 DUF4193 domain-containing protein [Paenarthrobacter aurescens]MDO6146989.1 DUF4193 domain-containing protein [Paenarthrobacter aurescens]MDO6158235.1 DUF4193 domain-containing protein [Paenarthrobacter aurescens]MDO6162219.1 DUF4193 domain-containing protein [Paenarthrobacter aurescens]